MVTEDRKHLRFVHASDLHLGCQQYRNYHRSYDYIRAFEEILQLSIHNSVDFIILGGDVFTSIDVLPGYFQEVLKLLKTFKIKYNIPIIAIEGNHDLRRYSHGSTFERGQSWLKIFADLSLIILLDAKIDKDDKLSMESYDFIRNCGGKVTIKNAVIYGTRFLKDKIEIYLPKIEKQIINDDGKFHILLQHFGIAGQMESVPGIPLDKVKILRKKIHYLALGHYHLQFKIENWIFNPGSPEPVSITENLFKRGIFLVDIHQEETFSVKVQSIKLKNRSYLWRTIKIPHSFENYEKLCEFLVQNLMKSKEFDKITSELSDLSNPILYLRLTGKIPLKTKKFNSKYVIKILGPQLKVIDIRIFSNFIKNLKNLDQFFIGDSIDITKKLKILQEN